MNLDPKALLAKYQPKESKQSLKAPVQVCAARFSPCGKVLAAGSFDGTIRRWDASGADPYPELPLLTGHQSWVQCLAFAPDKVRLFSADSWGRFSCWAYAEKESKPLWSVAQAHDGWVRKLAVSPDGQTIATCGMDRKVILWSADKGEKRAELPRHDQDVYSVSFHPDGKALVTGDLKGVVPPFELSSTKKVREFDATVTYLYERIQEVGGVRCLAFDATGATLAAAGGQPKTGGFVQAVPVLLFFDWATGKLKNTVKIGNDTEGYIHDLAWHADGFVMAVTSGQPGTGKLLFQQPEDAAPFFLAPKPNCHSLAVHPNGQRLVMVATNANSSGNGRNLGPNKEYPGNWSPLLVWDLPKS